MAAACSGRDGGGSVDSDAGVRDAASGHEDGGTRDGGPARDAGTQIDGAAPDGGVKRDGGLLMDAGRRADAGIDASASRDAGTSVDAGSDAGRDAGALRDASAERFCELYLRDITRAQRRGATVNGTEYYSSAVGDRDTGGHGREVYLIGADPDSGDPPFLHDYAGMTYDGYLVVTHTFDSDSSGPFDVEIDYVDLSGTTHTMKVYFPQFMTSDGRKATFLVGADGSTYWLDPENDGYNFAEEVLDREHACMPEHLARHAPATVP